MKSIDERLKKLQAEHPPGYTGSAVAPLPHYTKNDDPAEFDVAKHQVSVFRATDKWNALFEFLEDYENRPDAAEIWAAAQLMPGEGMEDGIQRVEELLNPVMIHRRTS